MGPGSGGSRESEAGSSREKCGDRVEIEEGREDDRNDEGKEFVMKETKNVDVSISVG